MFLPNTLILINSIFGFVLQKSNPYKLKFSEIKEYKRKPKLINFLLNLIMIFLIGLQAFNFGMITYLF